MNVELASNASLESVDCRRYYVLRLGDRSVARSRCCVPCNSDVRRQSAHCWRSVHVLTRVSITRRSVCVWRDTTRVSHCLVVCPCRSLALERAKRLVWLGRAVRRRRNKHCTRNMWRGIFRTTVRNSTAKGERDLTSRQEMNDRGGEQKRCGAQLGMIS